ncbi:MFS transporter, partial [bacterium]|nr:MFS transporter [bacterium]
MSNENEENLGLIDSFKVLLTASRAFWIINLVNFSDGIAYFGILTLLTRYLGTDLGMGVEKAGLAVSCFTGLVTLSVFGGGWIADKLGVRKTLIFSLGLTLAGRFALAICPQLASAGILTAWISLIFMAVGAGLLEPAVYSGV